MKRLIDLVEVISKQKIQHIDIIGQSHKPEKLDNILYEAICNKKVRTDEEGCILLYNDMDKMAAFKDVKRRLRYRLYDTSFFIDLNQPNWNDHRKAKFEINKLWCICQMLHERQLQKEAIKLYERLLPLALKFDQTTISLDSSRILANHYMVSNKIKSKAEYYIKIVKQMQQQMHLENISLDLKHELIYLIQYSSKIDIEKLSKIEVRIEKTLKTRIQLSEIVINYCYQMLSYIHILRKEYNESIRDCNKAIDLLAKKPYKPLKTLLLFREDLYFSHLYLHEFEPAEEYILENLSQVTYEGAYYYRTYSFYSNLAAYSGDFEKLYHIVAKIIDHKKLKNFPSYHQKLLIKEAYVNLLVRMGKIDESKQQKKTRKFRLSRFLNDVPMYAKDKRGSNISILIIQMLLLIVTKKYNKAIDRIDALKQYTYRYLRKDETFRSNCFIKMLTVVPLQDFHPVAIQRHTKDLYARLQTEPMILSEQSANVEVIPYETLWRFTIEALGGTLEDVQHK